MKIDIPTKAIIENLANELFSQRIKFVNENIERLSNKLKTLETHFKAYEKDKKLFNHFKKLEGGVI